MPYLIETYDDPAKPELRAQLRPEHLAYLDANAHLFIATGAKLDDDGQRGIGGIYLVDLDSREEAQSFIDADPFTIGGLFREIVIHPWRKAYVDGKCFL